MADCPTCGHASHDPGRCTTAQVLAPGVRVECRCDRRASGAVADLIRRGWLVPVQVFGADECCEHPEADCESKGYGLCDRFSIHTPGGSDCNRATFFLLRPSDQAMADPDVRAALEEVLDSL